MYIFILDWRFVYDFLVLISAPFITLLHEFLDLDNMHIFVGGLFFRCLLVLRYNIHLSCLPTCYSSFIWDSLQVMLLHCGFVWVIEFSSSAFLFFGIKFPTWFVGDLLPSISYWWFSHWFFSHFFFDVADFQLNVLNWIIFFFLNLSIYCICGSACAHQSTCKGVRGQLWGVHSLPPSYASWGLNSGHQSWKLPLHIESSYWPWIYLVLKEKFYVCLCEGWGCSMCECLCAQMCVDLCE